MCGSIDLIRQDSFFICQSCGSKYAVEEAKMLMICGSVIAETQKSTDRGIK